jgi:hypothetical protein
MKLGRRFIRCAGISSLVAAGIGAQPAQAQDFTGGVPGEWLSRFSSARTAGLGNAFVASANEPFGMLWNPAGLHAMYQNEVHFDTARLFEETQVQGLSFAMPMRKIPSFGVTVVSMRSGDFEQTNDLNEPMGSFKDENLAFILSASKSLNKKFSVGTSVKVVRQAVAEFDAAGFGADVGLQYDVTPIFRVGVSVLNIAGPSLQLRSTSESYPTEIRGGGAVKFLSGRGSFALEMDHKDGPGTTWHTGTEYWIHPTMAFRVGYDESYPAGGVSYKVTPEMRLDYGLTDHELGVTHRIGISYRFGGFFASSHATPEVFSPLGEQAVTKFELEAHAKADVDTWSLEIVDKQSQVVRRFSGRDQPPSHVMWDGKAESGMPLPDGLYTYQLVVTDREGRVMQDRTRTIEIATGGPQGSVPVSLE